MDSKGAAVMLAFMAGVMTGLADRDAMLGFVAFVLIAMSIWQYRLKS